MQHLRPAHSHLQTARAAAHPRKPVLPRPLIPCPSMSRSAHSSHSLRPSGVASAAGPAYRLRTCVCWAPAKPIAVPKSRPLSILYHHFTKKEKERKKAIQLANGSRSSRPPSFARHALTEVPSVAPHPSRPSFRIGRGTQETQAAIGAVCRIGGSKLSNF